jgi:hypothetical protein
MTMRQWIWGLVMAVLAAALSYILANDPSAALATGAAAGGAWFGGAFSILRRLRG